MELHNPEKAFGPVSTGMVLLTSGITLATRISGRGESDVDTIKILCRNLFNKQLSEHVQSSNLFAMDHGYLSKSMIEYIDSIGGNIIGTHKRVQTYPFTFGYQKVMGNRVNIEEQGAKMVYWATKNNKTTGKKHKALAYRSGKDHVATVFTTSPDINIGGFIYILKKNTKIPQIPPKIRKWMNDNVKELTFGQGGSEWHFIRSGLGIITSSVASMVLNIIALDKEFVNQYNIIATSIGLQQFVLPAVINNNHVFSDNELIVKTKSELRQICLSLGHKVSGTKEELISRIKLGRITNEDEYEHLIKNKLLQIWFMAPINNNTHMKIGQMCEPKIANKIRQFRQMPVIHFPMSLKLDWCNPKHQII